MVFRILPLRMDLIQEFSFYLHFEIAPCILVLNTSSRVGFEGPFKTASSELKKIQNWTVSLTYQTFKNWEGIIFQKILAEGIKIYLIVF